MVHRLTEEVLTYEIRLARYDEYDQIADFLDREWRKDHVFTKSRALFDWQHRNGDSYNFALSLDGNRILGVLGFIPSTQFDPARKPDSLWFSIWKVADEAKGQGIGRRLLGFVEQSYKPTIIGTVGASEMTLPLYRARGYRTGRMEHWYAMTSTVTLGRGNVPVRGPVQVPFKSQEYVRRRYLEHPFYKYEAVGNSSCVVVMRLCEAPEVRVRMLRVVDVIGSTAGFSHLPWRQIGERFDTKMIDLYCANIPARDIEAAGFKRRRGDEVIVPNHFEPYEARNVEIDYAIKVSPMANWRIVKGDGDMDRPNVIPAAVEKAT